LNRNVLSLISDKYFLLGDRSLAVASATVP